MQVGLGRYGQRSAHSSWRSEGRHDRTRALVLLAEQTGRQPADAGG